MYTATVLVVDDSSNIRMLLQCVLARAGYHVIEAANGHEAVCLARQYRPALVLLDLNLPALDGWEVARRIRAEPALDDTALVAMTGYCVGAAAQAALAAGCATVLFKPFNLDQLTREIAARIGVPQIMAEPATRNSVAASNGYALTHAV
jgi:CheY-like chemotaxis protein